MAFGFIKKKTVKNEEQEKKIETYSVVSIDIRRSVFHYYTMLGDDISSIQHRVKNYAGKAFDDEFYLKFKDALAGFVEHEPSESVRNVSVVVSDEAVALDCMRLPALKSLRLVENALKVKLADLYSNKDNLKILTFLGDKNKRYYSYNVAAMQKGIIDSISLACTDNNMLAQPITYASASTVAAVSELMPKWKTESYLFLDLKDIYSRFIFVANGRAVGFYTLPFGLEYVANPKYVQEDLLFDHTMAEITVLNAQERAKAKRLSILRELNGDAVDETEHEVMDINSMLTINGANDADDEDEEETAVALDKSERVEKPTAVENKQETQNPVDTPDGEGNVDENAENLDVAENADENTDGEEKKKPEQNEKLFVKKAARKLPMFMQRPVPETEEEIAKENFRVFVKWALSLLQGNPMLTALGEPKFVAVNLPKELHFIIEALKEEEKESGIEFVRFDGADDNEDMKKNLEVFGGLYAKNWHVSAKF